MLLAVHGNWPDALDLTVTCLVIGAFVAATVSGHVFLVLDVRAWIRSLRRALIVVTERLPHFPRWARAQTPRCLASLGLRLPCTEQRLLKKYRELVKLYHPDRGGNRRRFMRLQADFEESLAYLQRLKSDE